jgi:TonB-dependent starch-binding outer membrane protein SusC
MKHILLTLFLILPAITMAQQVISGRILSPDQLALPGASVHALKSKESAVTRPDGSFTIRIHGPADTLKISFIGYQDQFIPVRLPLEVPLLITLVQNSRTLDEVNVSTGYYELPRERATGSFTVLDTKTLNQSTSTDIISRLKGVSNAVLFDERVKNNRNISVRGLSTIYADTQPLIVLNNFPFDGDLNSINPNDVETITILKDAAAASIWGVRAANGVLVITTKKGAFNRPAQLSFNSNVTIGQKPDLFYLPGMSSADFIDVETNLFQQGFYAAKEADPSHPPLTPVVELLIAARDGLITAAEADAQIAGLKQQDIRKDYNKYLSQNSLNQQYALNLQGGTDKSVYYYSAGYDRNRGTSGDQNTRFSLRADHVYQVRSRFTLKPSVSYSLLNTAKGAPDITEITSGYNNAVYPYARLADDSGNALPVVKYYRSSFAGQFESRGLLDMQYRPLTDYRDQENSSKAQELLMSMDAEYDLTKNLSVQLLYQYDRNWAETTELYGPNSFYTRDLVNQFTQVDPTGTLSFPVPKGSILDLGHSSFRSHTGRGQLNYQKDILKNSISALAGAEVREVIQEGNGYRTYGYDPSGLISVPVDYTSLYNLYTDPNNTQGIPYSTNFSKQLNRYTSYYANAAYTYDNRYSISASGRKDASNLFGVNSNQRGVPLWSAGLSWNAHNEAFFSSRILDYLKLRLTYGYNGNLSKNLSALATVAQSGGNLNNMPYASVRTFPNPDLSWEKISILNAGVDFKTSNGFLSGTLDYYKKQGRDLIGDQAMDPTSGVISGTIRRNTADMTASGIDLTLNTRNIDKGFKWYSSILFNYNTSKVTANGDNQKSAYQYTHAGLGQTPVIGRPLQAIYTYKWAGLDPATGDPLGFINGEKSSAYGDLVYNSTLEDLEYHGPAAPVRFGLLGNTFSYKNLSLLVNISYRLGYYFTRPSISYSRLYNSWVGHADFAQRWQKPGDERFTSVPSMKYPADDTRDEFYYNSSALVEKGDHIRFQDINLSYQFSTIRLKALKMQGMQLYANLRNPGFIWRASKLGLDPDFTYTPPGASVAFGMKASF